MVKVTLLPLCFLLSQTDAFSPTRRQSFRKDCCDNQLKIRGNLPASKINLSGIEEEQSSMEPKYPPRGALLSIGGLSAGLLSSVGTAVAAAESADYEIAELPPPYIPVLFAVVLLGGVGLLTGSLGDVMTEEAQLGMMSGAKAKKEMERSRSSYFKKR